MFLNKINGLIFVIGIRYVFSKRDENTGDWRRLLNE
jgi:hypothetical protein